MKDGTNAMTATSIDQGKRLVELGMNTESADMCWTNHYYGNLRGSLHLSAKTISEYKKYLEGFADSTSIDSFYPAWSLSSLMEWIKHEIDDEFYLGIDSCVGEDWLWQIGVFSYETGHVKSFEAKTLIECAYEVVVWLLENK